MKVFILVTVRNQELLPFAELVFKTIRVGFPTLPTTDIRVHLNGVTEENRKSMEHIELLARAQGCTVTAIDQTTHHQWIYQLLVLETQGFWIVDTDVIFYAPVEHWNFEKPLAGAFIPEFNDEFTKSVTRSRLHTSLMWIEPIDLQTALLKYEARHPNTIYNPPANPVHPVYLPLNGRTYFHDTMSIAYHAAGGQPFTAAQKNAYFHFHFGSCSDVVLPHLTDGLAKIKAAREAILANHAHGVGAWRMQEEYFLSRQFVPDGEDVIDPIDPKDAEEARKWNIELCRGNETAMVFCDMWYRYCHGIDDLIDTMVDGRPRMSRDQMVSLFFLACCLYNSSFYIQNREALAPIILLVTNTYRDSVTWEGSPKSHLRQMADVFRTCGNEMYVMIALICGGEAHMRKMSMAIKERDWLGQHDETGQPT